MPYPAYDPTGIVDAAGVALRRSDVVMVDRNPEGVPFDRMRPAQNWVIPTATEEVIAWKLATKNGSLDFENPRLVPTAIPLAWCLVPNIQDNPSSDGFVAMLLPAPLDPLPEDHYLVTMGSGAFLVPQIYLRKGAAPAPAPPSASDGFTAKERAFILDSLVKLLNR